MTTYTVHVTISSTRGEGDLPVTYPHTTDGDLADVITSVGQALQSRDSEWTRTESITITVNHEEA